MVWTLAVAQVISWGSLYYAFSLFVVPMQETLGWSRPLLNGALSLGLRTSSVPPGSTPLTAARSDGAGK